MALYETLIEGGHEHLIDAVKARIAQKADAIIEDELKPIIGNQPSSTLEGELLVAEDAADLPPVMVGVDGRSTQFTTTGKNLLDPNLSHWVSKSIPNTGNRSSYFIPAEEGATYHWHRTGGNFYLGVAWCNDTDLTDYHQIAMWTPTTNASVINSNNYAYLLLYTNSSDSAAFLSRSPIIEKGSTYTGYEPYTSGKPSPNPDYPQPIVSVDEPALTACGRNMFDAESAAMFVSYNDRYYNPSSTDVITKNGSEFTFGPHLSNHGMKLGVGKLLAGTYTVSVNKSASCSVYVSTSDEMYGDGVPYKSPFGAKLDNVTSGSFQFTLENAAWVSVGIYVNSTEEIYISDIQIEIGSTATDYEPYAGHTVSLLPDGYSLRSLPNGTKDELHLSYLRPSTREGWAVYSRELVRRVGEHRLAGLSWTRYTSVQNPRFRSSYVTGMLASATGKSVLCDAYRNRGAGSILATHIDKTIYQYSTHAEVLVDDSSYESANDFAASLGDAYILFPFTGSYITTTQLDPIELPVLPSKHVTVWSDPTADLKLTYVIDSETIEESLESGIGKAFSSVAPVETSPATDSHGVGSRIVYNETLYKVTSAIAAGEDIVPGTNVTATTVAAELLATQA